MIETRNINQEPKMNYRIKDIPPEFLTHSADPLRTLVMLKAGNFVAGTVIAIGASMIAYVLFPGLFN